MLFVFPTYIFYRICLFLSTTDFISRFDFVSRMLGIFSTFYQFVFFCLSINIRQFSIHILARLVIRKVFETILPKVFWRSSLFTECRWKMETRSFLLYCFILIFLFPLFYFSFYFIFFLDFVFLICCWRTYILLLSKSYLILVCCYWFKIFFMKVTTTSNQCFGCLLILMPISVNCHKITQLLLIK